MAALTAMALASLGASVFNAVEGAKKKPTPPPLPVAPPAPVLTSPAAPIQRAKAPAVPGMAGTRSATLLTGPSGLTQPATTQGKTLLGL